MPAIICVFRMNICIRPKGSEPYNTGICFKCSCCGLMKAEYHFVDNRTDSVFSTCNACRIRSRHCMIFVWGSYLVKERIMKEQLLKASITSHVAVSPKKVSFPTQHKNHYSILTPLCIIPHSKWIPVSCSCFSVVAKPVIVSKCVFSFQSYTKTSDYGLQSPVCN